MPRARNIKPSFFTNDQLADVDPLGRLLFIGLWTLADREGRLEDRPRRIRAEILPYDDADVDALLDVLSRRGFITRYAAGGGRFIQVLAFAKHQHPHIKEPASSIPAPDEPDARLVQPPTPPDAANADVSDHYTENPNIGAAPDKPGASPVQAPDKPGAKTSDSGFLIPDSGYLIPEVGGGTRARSVDLSIAARRHGIECNGQDPRLIAIGEQGVDDGTFDAACAEAVKAYPGERITVGLVGAILTRWAKAADRIRANGATAPPARRLDQQAAIIAELTGAGRKQEVHDVDARVVRTDSTPVRTQIRRLG